MNRILLFLLRILLGSFFVLSGLFKGMDVRSFAAVVSAFDLTPDTWSVVLAVIIIGCEIVCGMMLLLGISPHRNAIALFSLVAVFTVVLISAQVRGIDISCGCFGAASSGGIIDRWTILRNILLLLLLGMTALGSRGSRQ